MYKRQGANSLFCGDTLFACGCGRLFEGTPPQMSASLAKLAALPDDTRVFCGHEYTLANIAFAAAVEPGNAALKQRETEERRKRAQDLPTLPSAMGLEKATNPFLRASVPAVAAAAARTPAARSPARSKCSPSCASGKTRFDGNARSVDARYARR